MREDDDFGSGRLDANGDGDGGKESEIFPGSGDIGIGAGLLSIICFRVVVDFPDIGENTVDPPAYGTFQINTSSYAEDSSSEL